MAAGENEGQSRHFKHSFKAGTVAYHRSQPNDYGGYFPAPESDEDDEPAAVFDVEVEINLETAPTATAD